MRSNALGGILFTSKAFELKISPFQFI
jgi:hypothetical protein